ncbi:hypothetical protein M3Y99_00395100 [Aphelenchoides fujianensis]|nr:hypothetical protein M3Y99_00395100 [Aphelenchoides fujianensis]
MAKLPYSLATLVLIVWHRSVADMEYSDTQVRINKVTVGVDGTFSGTGGANLTLDVKLTYGYPILSTTNRSIKTWPLTTDGLQSYPFPDLYFSLQNPLTFIHARATAELKYYTNGSQTKTYQDLFSIQSFNWTTWDWQQINVSFPTQNWWISINYKKDCATHGFYGFACGFECPDPVQAVECYTCDPINGTKQCCPDDGVDPNTCLRQGQNRTRPLTCEEKLEMSENDNQTQRKWKRVYFWLMIAFIILLVIFLIIILACLFCCLHYKRKAAETQEQSNKTTSYPPSVVQPASITPAPYTEAYQRSLRRRERGPSIPISPSPNDEDARFPCRPWSRSIRSPLRTSTRFKNLPLDNAVGSSNPRK